MWARERARACVCECVCVRALSLSELKKLQGLAEREQVLEAVLARNQDFQEDLNKEKQAVEAEILSRIKEMEMMVAEAQKEAFESVYTSRRRLIGSKRSKPSLLESGTLPLSRSVSTSARWWTRVMTRRQSP